MSSLDVGVVGAGIVGLSAAINIQRLIRRVKVTVVADNFGRDTATPVTPCIFLPIPSCIRGVDSTKASEWLTDSWTHHYQMANSPEGKESGQSFMSGHYLWSHLPDRPNKIMPTLVKEYHLLDEQEKEALHFTYRHACRITTVVIDPIKYMQWLMKEFRQRGGQVVSDTAYSLQQLYGQFDVVVNCVGTRGRETVQDPYLVPVKGYVVQVEHECPKNFLITDDPITVIPHAESSIVDVGHILEPDVFSQEKNMELVELLLNKVKALVPSLMGSTVIESYVSRRPYRSPPLIKIEMVRCGGPVLPVVHNIGQGLETVTLAWGMGAEVAHLVQDVLRLVKPFPHMCRPFNTLA
ncbi:unnamed protein product [Candidula unifasciata]|uniref:FAD dependent oxidoreductase domain-containing protein n=1 Tax=Candidula unifasciata TaxID=100452 RepID=A0A8S3YP76_9EUPU|nr:unnamed protein product [Candidula unifasciata]